MPLDREASFTWLGHSAVLVQTQAGKSILFDPWLENPKSPITADEITTVDVLLVSHGHFDHAGGALSNALMVASRTRPVWPAVHEMDLWLRRNYAYSDGVIGMNKGGSVETAGMRVTMTAADHSAGDWNAAGETTLYFGEPVGFIVELDDGFTFYFAGDTNVMSDMRLIGEMYRPELALLPIGGHYTMGPRGAAMATEMLGVSHVLPIHWGTFPVLTGNPDELRVELDARGLSDVEVHGWAPGETVR
jgi:L-ascorbate metabolism protein UlaG (beta-lactamase superfamily)